MSKGKTITVRMSAELLAAIELVARLECRSTSGQIEYMASAFVARNYPKALEPGAKLTLSTAMAPPREGFGS